jgi:Ser-tRNA(Ala) deacylase AlaX
LRTSSSTDNIGNSHSSLFLLIPWRPNCYSETTAPEPGEILKLEIDWPRRYALMRLHTALHVMSCVVVAPVTGGNIAPDKARLDFDIDMSLLDAARIEHETNVSPRSARSAY